MVIFAFDSDCIEAYPGAVQELFGVKFDKEKVFDKLDKVFLKYSNSEQPKMIIKFT